jgi:hypothetical protein
MWLSAGSYLSKLKRLGYLHRDISGSQVVWSISAKGIEALGEKL